MEEENTELRNPFPSPPSHYTKYTTHNLHLLELLKERSPDDPDPNQHHVLKDQTDIPDWPLLQLEKPRVDWILEEPDAHYHVFGEKWQVKETVPSLADEGGDQVYPSDPTIDRRPILRSLLRSLLVTYSALTGSLLTPPPVSPEVPPDWQRHVTWISNLSQNFVSAVNGLRPFQARGNLEMMMRRQLELRKEETKNIHEKCDTLGARLTELRLSMQKLLAETENDNRPNQDVHASHQGSSSDITHNDVLNWEEQV